MDEEQVRSVTVLLVDASSAGESADDVLAHASTCAQANHHRHPATG